MCLVEILFKFLLSVNPIFKNINICFSSSLATPNTPCLYQKMLYRLLQLVEFLSALTCTPNYYYCKQKLTRPLIRIPRWQSLRRNCCENKSEYGLEHYFIVSIWQYDWLINDLSDDIMPAIWLTIDACLTIWRNDDLLILKFDHSVVFEKINYIHNDSFWRLLYNICIDILIFCNV